MQKAKETLNLVSQCRRSPPAIMYNEDAGSGIVICTWSEICNSYTGAYSLSHRWRLRLPCTGCDQTTSSVLRILRTLRTRMSLSPFVEYYWHVTTATHLTVPNFSIPHLIFAYPNQRASQHSQLLFLVFPLYA